MGQQHLAGRVTVALVEDHQVVVDGVRSWFRPPGPVELVAHGPTIESVQGWTPTCCCSTST